MQPSTKKKLLLRACIWGTLGVLIVSIEICSFYFVVQLAVVIFTLDWSALPLCQ